MLEAHPSGTRSQFGLVGGAQGPGVSSVVVVVVLGGTRRKVYFTVQLFS